MIAIIQYNAGNTASVKNAVERLGYPCRVTDCPEEIRHADKVIFPGVGEAGSAMQYLRERGLDRVIVSLRQPTLGVCLGLQLLCRFSEEGSTPCMGVFDAEVKRFPADDIVPHMGWNTLRDTHSPLFSDFNTGGEGNTGDEARGDNAGDSIYFVHSYYAGLSKDTIATCDYIVPFSAAMWKSNFYATQFHPEKSGPVGEQILRNFLKL